MEHKKTPLISPVPGTERVIHSFHFGHSGAEPKVYIQSSLHADELPGMLVVWKLKQILMRLEAENRIRGEIILVPVANPIGQNQHLMDVHLGRYDMETGQNFNRGYMVSMDRLIEKLEPVLDDDTELNRIKIKQALRDTLDDMPVKTELQSLQKILQTFCCDANVILDLHCDFEAITHIYSTHYSWPKIEPLARYLRSPVNMLADDTGGSPFDSCFDMTWKRLQDHFGRDKVPFNCCAATLELKGQADVCHQYADDDALAILNFLGHQGAVNVDIPPIPVESAVSGDLDAVEPLTSSMGGMVVLHVLPGEKVAANQVVAEIIDPIEDKIEVIRATQPGIVFSRTNRRMATAGMLIAHISGSKKIRSGYLLAP
ncbi:succinylglutamate desuccinylase/aspartoacylase family protein [Vibrio salinus]|uniref:succinylglutamate desuccinylase/aspartoacylase family protein n=1 Tax=Vibrio salinus TaxID=2899784 RepID=UPI001E2FF0C4|nr:succinylglutamate desuccinylase/aspartoacylase family protein [Vibrio salinus]MCE0493642.1 M14 family metallopeptidase [Vibrio salinus]